MTRIGPRSIHLIADLLRVLLDLDDLDDHHVARSELFSQFMYQSCPALA